MNVSAFIVTLNFLRSIVISFCDFSEKLTGRPVRKDTVKDDIFLWYLYYREEMYLSGMKHGCLLLIIFCSCASVRKMQIPEHTQDTLTGSEFYKQAVSMMWKQRDSFALREILAGDMPDFLRKFVAVRTSVTDSATGRHIHAVYYVSPDYMSIGSNKDWARIPLTPMAAQQIADSFHCFLPTRKMVNDIYKAAKVKLEPVPMYAFRDSTVTMWQHHLIIEGQRKGRKGLIAGIKKDVVISGKISRDPKPDRVAIYGWQRSNGVPIQPLYTGHVDWYVDYSHGIRLVYRKIKVNGHWMDYTDVLKDEKLKRLLCDEENCDFYRYN
ncbi:MAG TPA: hypothetical protein VG847_05880 [Chitinophagaceae bacterium]|nr:hypothetical protein [Chitinophagaceae bacterium]